MLHTHSLLDILASCPLDPTPAHCTCTRLRQLQHSIPCPTLRIRPHSSQPPAGISCRVAPSSWVVLSLLSSPSPPSSLHCWHLHIPNFSLLHLAIPLQVAWTLPSHLSQCIPPCPRRNLLRHTRHIAGSSLLLPSGLSALTLLSWTSCLPSSPLQALHLHSLLSSRRHRPTPLHWLCALNPQVLHFTPLSPLRLTPHSPHGPGLPSSLPPSSFLQHLPTKASPPFFSIP